MSPNISDPSSIDFGYECDLHHFSPKDTSLVVIIALFDFLKTNMTILNDPQWMGFSAEAYIFAALIYFLCCFFMSNYSRRLERELETGF